MAGRARRVAARARVPAVQRAPRPNGGGQRGLPLPQRVLQDPHPAAAPSSHDLDPWRIFLHWIREL